MAETSLNFGGNIVGVRSDANGVEPADQSTIDTTHNCGEGKSVEVENPSVEDSIDQELEKRLSSLIGSNTELSNDEPAVIFKKHPHEERQAKHENGLGSFLDEFLNEPSQKQKTIRLLDDSSTKVVHLRRCCFEKGQSCFVVHVPFFPPLKNVPIVDASSFDTETRIRITERNRFGLRIEVISLNRNHKSLSESVEVVVQIIAQDDKTETDLGSE